MEDQFDYYLPVETKNGPVLAPTSKCPRYLNSTEPIEGEPEMMHLGLMVKEINPQMNDYLTLPNPVVSKKIYDVLSPLNIKTIRLLDSIVYVNGEVYENKYWVIHIHKDIECIDKDLSICEFEINSLENIEKLVLDRKVLGAIPLEDRLIFCLEEASTYYLFHKSVVDIIMGINPEGMGFKKFESWDDKAKTEMYFPK